MDATASLGQFLKDNVYPFLTGTALASLLAYVIFRQRWPSERRLLESQSSVQDVNVLKERVTVVADVIEIYREGNEDAVGQIRKLKREKKCLEDRVEDLEGKNKTLQQNFDILSEMKGVPAIETETPRPLLGDKEE